MLQKSYYNIFTWTTAFETLPSLLAFNQLSSGYIGFFEGFFL